MPTGDPMDSNPVDSNPVDSMKVAERISFNKLSEKVNLNLLNPLNLQI